MLITYEIYEFLGFCQYPEVLKRTGPEHPQQLPKTPQRHPPRHPPRHLPDTSPDTPNEGYEILLLEYAIPPAAPPPAPPEPKIRALWC